MVIGAMVLLFLAMMALGFPVFVAMGIAGLVGSMLLGDTHGLLQNSALGLYQSFSSFELVALPLYILVGTLMERADLSRKLFIFARVWFGQLKGGLAVATVVACSLFAAISGSSVATAATVGVVALPMLASRGYRPEFSGAMIAAGGTLGILIPPSIAMIVFGVITEQSIGALFIAGVVPGLLLATAFGVYAALTSKIEPEFHSISLRERLVTTKEAAGAVALPLLIIVSIYSGLATPTEAAALAAAYVLVFGVATGSLGWREIHQAGLDAARTSVMIFLLVGFGKMLTEFFTLSDLPQRTTAFVSSLDVPGIVIVTLIIGVLLVLGMFLESLSMLLVTVPILFPLMTEMGFHPLAFGVFMVLAVEAALITPPVGLNLFAICSIGKINIVRMSRQAIPYVALLVSMMYLVLYLPEIATWLPSTMR